MVRRRDGVSVLELGQVCVLLWHGAVTTVSFGWQRDGLREVVKRHPEGVAILCVIEESAKPPNDALRRASVQMVADHGELIKAISFVIEARGFGAGVVRAVISAFALLHRGQQPAAAFSNTTEALTWMRQWVPVDSVVAAVHDIDAERARLHAVSP
jgi:hypothetical protein